MHQIELDGKITDLVQDMQALYAFLKGTDPSKYDGPQNKIVTSLAQQTIECAYFIRQYACDPNFCKFYFILLILVHLSSHREADWKEFNVRYRPEDSGLSGSIQEVEIGFYSAYCL